MIIAASRSGRADSRDRDPAVGRGVLAGAAVLVLDQPTARLDPRTASELIEDVLSAAGNQAVLRIAHRSERLDRVNRVVRWRGMK